MSKIIQYANLASGDISIVSMENGNDFIDQDTDISNLYKQIDLNTTAPTFRITVLYPDETVNYEIPQDDIKIGGSYSENYQNGQRRSLSFTLYNDNGRYNPNINVLWAGTRLRLDMGLVLMNGNTLWFRKGYYIINKITPSLTPTGKEVAISATDKFSLFENSTGKLEDTYKIETGTNIREIIESIQQTEMGNGSIFDAKPLIYHSSFEDKKTQVDISKSAGDTYGSILLDLATQLSAEIFYNADGNLVLIPTTEVTEDHSKPLIYNFYSDNGDISQLNFDYDYNTIVNRIVVIGSSSNGGVYQATAINSDESSPLCYQRIGYRTGNIINDSNITSDVLAEERALYELRQQLILKTTTSSNVVFNPFLNVNNLISISDSFFELEHEKYLLQSISCSLDYSGVMNIGFTNVNNVVTDVEIVSSITLKKIENVDLSNVQYTLTVLQHHFIDTFGFSIIKYDQFDPTRDQLDDNGSSYGQGSKIYVYAWIDSKLYSPPNKQWIRVKEYVVEDTKWLYCIPYYKTDYPIFGSDDGHIIIEDAMNDGRGIDISDISAYHPNVKTKVSLSSDNTTVKDAATLFYRQRGSNTYNSIGVGENSPVFNLSAGQAVQWYITTRNNNYEVVNEVKHSGDDPKEVNINLLTPTVPNASTRDPEADPQTVEYQNNISLKVRRIPMLIYVNFTREAINPGFNFNVNNKIQQIDIAVVCKEEGEPDYDKKWEYTLEQNSSKDEHFKNTYLGTDKKMSYEITTTPKKDEVYGDIYVSSTYSGYCDELYKIVNIPKPSYQVASKLKVCVGVGCKSMTVRYMNTLGQPVTRYTTQTITISDIIQGSTYMWDSEAEDDYVIPYPSGSKVKGIGTDSLQVETTGWHTVLSGSTSFTINGDGNKYVNVSLTDYISGLRSTRYTTYNITMSFSGDGYSNSKTITNHTTTQSEQKLYEYSSYRSSIRYELYSLDYTKLKYKGYRLYMWYSSRSLNITVSNVRQYFTTYEDK